MNKPFKKKEGQTRSGRKPRAKETIVKKTIGWTCLLLLLVLLPNPALATTTNTSPSGSGSLSYTGTGYDFTCTVVVSGEPPKNYTYIQVDFSGSYIDPSGASHPFGFNVVTSSPGYGINAKADNCPKPTATPDNTVWGTYYTVATTSFPPVVTSYVVTVTFPRGGGNASLTGSVVENAGVSGFVSPKYKVVGIDYTVPGEQSYVQYTDTTMMGTSTSTSSSFSTTVASSLEICGGAGVASAGKTKICGTYSNSFAQESDTSSSFAVSQTTSYQNKWFPLTGPALDHGNDVIYVWVNPQVWYTMFPTGSKPYPLLWNGYTYDTLDDSNNMEVIPIRLSQLLNPSTIPTGTQGRLLRAWASNNTDGSGPAITNQDLLNIAALDPFSNPNYTVTIGSDGKTTTDSRFTQTTADPLFYVDGGNYMYNWTYTTTDTEGQGGKTTYSEGFAIEVSNSNNFILDISVDWKESTTFTWVDQWNILMTQMMSQMNSVSITGPTGTYTGPDEFNVYQDNVYGTFMVAPVPPE